MLEGNDLIGACEDDVMVSDDGTATDSGNADFAGIPLFALLTSVVYILVDAVGGLIDGVCQGQGGAAGSIQLLVVMLFYNLDIKACSILYLE